MRDSFSKDDLKYVMAAMKDQLHQHFPTAVYGEVDYNEIEELDDLTDFNDSVKIFQKQAAKSNCKSVIVYYLQAKKIRDDKDSNYRITLEEMKYDNKGFQTEMQMASVTTKELTTIEAAIFAMENLNRN